MERARLEVDFNGPQGNVFYPLGRTVQILISQGREKEADELYKSAFEMRYAEVLYNINKYVELVDTGKPKTLKNYLKQGEKYEKERSN